MSSHREAPEISKDPVADNTDVYAFVSPDKPDTVTIITNYVPAEGPAGGPNFYEFGNDVLYSIYIDNDGDGLPEVTYEFRFQEKLLNPNTFPYNAGQRNDPFFVDLGSIFDLADLRPFQNLHLIPTAAAPGVDTLETLNVHAIAIQIPISKLTADGSVPKDATSSKAVLGIWGAASRRKVRIADRANDERSEAGPWVQVSR